MRIILASCSPRRSEIMTAAGIRFSVVPSDADESLPGGIPAAEAVAVLAERKARTVAAVSQLDDLIIAADTVVECYGEILGKPADRDDAVRMLTMLSGCGSSVHTGVCMMLGGRVASAVETTYVTFDGMDEEEINAYADSNEPYDKAGAYAIQGRASLYVAGITGDYFNVMGLPIHAVYKLAKREFGVDITDIDGESDSKSDI